ncbi:hypothetical protein IEQ34_012548 [Dendrobium chrysotoxum]|uniref:Uncharacterized protein n=1 Tax=Dendrobium chrysotoxum TaxID=161865 RepID=A0AAV7GD80_DENCH|nr:hypothetical protein IEQ34_012548 [Dendrobium chrysotoxum]
MMVKSVRRSEIVWSTTRSEIGVSIEIGSKFEHLFLEVNGEEVEVAAEDHAVPSSLSDRNCVSNAMHADSNFLISPLYCPARAWPPVENSMSIQIVPNLRSINKRRQSLTMIGAKTAAVFKTVVRRIDKEDLRVEPDSFATPINLGQNVKIRLRQMYPHSPLYLTCLFLFDVGHTYAREKWIEGPSEGKWPDTTNNNPDSNPNTDASAFEWDTLCLQLLGLLLLELLGFFMTGYPNEKENSSLEGKAGLKVEVKSGLKIELKFGFKMCEYFRREEDKYVKKDQDPTYHSRPTITFIVAYLSPQALGKNLLIGANFSSVASGYYDGTAILYHAIPFSQQLEYYKEYLSKLAKVAGSSKASSLISQALYILSVEASDFI